jgi:hypothetical protein
LPKGHFETAVPGLAAVMREAQKIKRLRLLPSPLSLLSRITSERQKFRLGGFDLQVEFPQPLRKHPVKPLRILPILKAGQKVIRKTKEVGFPSAPFAKTPLKP